MYKLDKRYKLNNLCCVSKSRSTSITEKVCRHVAELAPGQLVTYTDFRIEPGQFAAVAAALSRLYRQGVLERYARGTYYRPKETRFGRLQPSQASIVETLTTKQGKAAGYVSGAAVYNELGFTTQVPGQITIASPRPRRSLPERVRYVVREAPKLPADVPLLQLLDVLRDVKRVPGATPDAVVARLRQHITGLDEAARQRLTWLARRAAPRVRAVLGAVLELHGDLAGAGRLRATLNQVTSYHLGISTDALPNRQAWRIR
jgi:hypothetical protein